VKVIRLRNIKMGAAMQDLEHLKEWIGRTETGTDYVTIPTVHRLAATLDRDDPLPKPGDPLPYLWHMVLFPRIVRHSQLGGDGHPKRGDFLPPVPLPRRMFAGRRVTFHDDLRVGDEAHREATIKDVVIKEGRSGPMVFVTMKVDISTSRGLALTEEHDIAYRDNPKSAAPPAPPQPAPANAVWAKTTTPDPVMLFRMSALVFNGHRIHIDYPYVTKVEGYPNLVVPGSLHTLLMLELVRDHKPDVRYRSIAWRNVRPLFVDRRLTVCGEPSADGKSAKLWVMDAEDALALSADAQFH
jgi:3-methylfumaryl-CoA hydratase